MERVRIKPRITRERIEPRITRERIKIRPRAARKGMSPDLAARKVIVAAWLYYVGDRPIMSDGEYDKLSQYVADNWDDLLPDQKWALRDPDSVRAGGSHIRFARRAVCGALQAYADHFGCPRPPEPSRWKIRKDGVHYTGAYRT